MFAPERGGARRHRNLAVLLVECGLVGGQVPNAGTCAQYFATGGRREHRERALRGERLDVRKAHSHRVDGAEMRLVGSLCRIGVFLGV